MIELNLIEISKIGDVLRAIRTTTNKMLGDEAQHNLVKSNLDYLIKYFDELDK
jgi:hypothetical protein